MLCFCNPKLKGKSKKDDRSFFYVSCNFIFALVLRFDIVYVILVMVEIYVYHDTRMSLLLFFIG